MVRRLRIPCQITTVSGQPYDDTSYPSPLHKRRSTVTGHSRASMDEEWTLLLPTGEMVSCDYNAMTNSTMKQECRLLNENEHSRTSDVGDNSTKKQEYCQLRENIHSVSTFDEGVNPTAKQECRPLNENTDSGTFAVHQGGSCEFYQIEQEETTPTETDRLIDSVEDDAPKAETFNLVIMTLIFVIWLIANSINGSVYRQYLYRRIMKDVFGNSTLLPPGRLHQKVSPVCYTPSSNNTNKTEAYALQEKTQQMMAEMNMQISLCSYSFSLISTLVIGAYSDYCGRKTLFFIPMLGHFLDFVMVSVIINLELNLNFFYLTASVKSICTGELFTIASYAYVADNTPASRSRTLSLVVLNVIQNLTTALLSTAVGYFIRNEGYLLPSLSSACIILIALLLVVFVLPQKPTRPEHRKSGECRNDRLTPVQALQEASSFYCSGSSRTRMLFLLSLGAYLTHSVSHRTDTVDALWKMNFPLCMGPASIGVYTTVSAVLSQVITVPSLKLLQRCCSDSAIAVWSSAASTAALVLKSFAYTSAMLYGVSIVSVLDLSVTALIQSLMSRMTSSGRQGALFASLGVVNILCAMAGDSMFSVVYRYTVDNFRELTYIMCAALQAVSTVCLIVFTSVPVSQMGTTSRRPLWYYSMEVKRPDT